MKLVKFLSERGEFLVLVLFGIFVAWVATVSIVYGLVPLIKTWDGTAAYFVPVESTPYDIYPSQNDFVGLDSDIDLDNEIDIVMLEWRLLREMKQAQAEGISNQEYIEIKTEALKLKEERLKKISGDLDEVETLILKGSQNESAIRKILLDVDNLLNRAKKPDDDAFQLLGQSSLVGGVLGCNVLVEPISSVKEGWHLAGLYLFFIGGLPSESELEIYESALLERVGHSKTEIEVVYEMLSLLNTPLDVEGYSTEHIRLQLMSKFFSSYLSNICIAKKVGKDVNRRWKGDDSRCIAGV